MKKLARIAKEAMKKKLKSSLIKLINASGEKPKIESDFEMHEKLVEHLYGKVQGDYKVDKISQELNNKLITLIKSSEPVLKETWDREDLAISWNSSLILSRHQRETVNKLAKDVLGECYVLNNENEAVIELHQTLQDTYRKYIGSPSAIVNSRAWITKPRSEDFGPTALHKDGFAPGHLKIMIYPYGLDDKKGALVIGQDMLSDFPAGTCIAFLNSDVEHKAVAGCEESRLCIEVTLQRTITEIRQYTTSEFNGRHYSNPANAYLYSQTKSNRFPTSHTKYINIGSGNRSWSGWLLLDEIENEKVYPFRSSENSSIPACDNMSHLVYSSHHIEHISDSVLKRIVAESYRVLKPGGHLLLKFPDYDYFLSEYRKGNLKIMDDKGIESVIWTWKNKGLDDTIENRLAMMFCGYWNEQYGDHFSGNIDVSKDSYHGPPIVEQKELKELFYNHDPESIAKILKRKAMEDENFKAFNHQSAWSQCDLSKRVEEHGFINLNSTKSEISGEFVEIIPDLLSMYDWSAYSLFQKRVGD